MNLVLMYLVQQSLQTSLLCLPAQLTETAGKIVCDSQHRMHDFGGPVNGVEGVEVPAARVLLFFETTVISEGAERFMTGPLARRTDTGKHRHHRTWLCLLASIERQQLVGLSEYST